VDERDPELGAAPTKERSWASPHREGGHPGGVNVFRVQDGQLVERWGRTDELGFLQQLGLVQR
jgi:hypothetical protein